MIASVESSFNCWYQGLPGQCGTMIVARAPLQCNLMTKSSSGSHGGLHQLCSDTHESLDNRKESTASVPGSSHLEL